MAGFGLTAGLPRLTVIGPWIGFFLDRRSLSSLVKTPPNLFNLCHGTTLVILNCSNDLDTCFTGFVVATTIV